MCGTWLIVTVDTKSFNVSCLIRIATVQEAKRKKKKGLTYMTNRSSYLFPSKPSFARQV